jgi:vanillate/4-hydroxybenzoate decarboxylase subunit D
MPAHFTRPEELTLTVERTAVALTCPECGSKDVRRYPVVAEEGWMQVVKCQDCFHSLDRAHLGRLGSVTLLSDGL